MMDRTRGREPQQTAKPLHQPRKRETPPIPHDPAIPDVYAEGVQLYVTYNSISFVFNKGLGKPYETLPVAVVRMSPQQAFLTMQISHKALKQYEDEVGKFQVPDQLLKELEIERELY